VIQEINDAVSFIKSIIARQNDFECIDIQSAIVMNFQAALLHNQQHAAASLALNFSVIESIIKEIYHAYGLVNGSQVKSFANKTHTLQAMSRTQYNKMNSKSLIDELHNGGLITDTYHFQILDKLRLKRNDLMHRGKKVSSQDSGNCQGAVKNLWFRKTP